MVNMDEISLRWHQATVCNNFMVWRALSYWMADESMNAEVDGRREECDETRLLSDLAMQYVDDLSSENMEATA